MAHRLLIISRTHANPDEGVDPVAVALFEPKHSHMRAAAMRKQHYLVDALIFKMRNRGINSWNRVRQNG